MAETSDGSQSRRGRRKSHSRRRRRDRTLVIVVVAILMALVTWLVVANSNSGVDKYGRPVHSG